MEELEILNTKNKENYVDKAENGWSPDQLKINYHLKSILVKKEVANRLNSRTFDSNTRFQVVKKPANAIRQKAQSAVQYKDHILFIGRNEKKSNIVDSFHLLTKEYDHSFLKLNEEMKKLGLLRFHQCIVYSNLLLVIGGLNRVDVAVYNLESQQLVNKNRILLAIDSFSCVKFKNALYIYGGLLDNMGVILRNSSIFRIDLTSMDLERLSAPSFPRGRNSHGATLMKLKTNLYRGQYMVIMGGFLNVGERTNDMWMCKLDNNQKNVKWIQLNSWKGVYPEPRNGLKLLPIDTNRMLLVGGIGYAPLEENSPSTLGIHMFQFNFETLTVQPLQDYHLIPQLNYCYFSSISTSPYNFWISGGIGLDGKLKDMKFTHHLTHIEILDRPVYTTYQENLRHDTHFADMYLTFLH
mmetsp:Transcript_4685/g.6935  ORF Transcript_4685/g.6935 Transcript_4685/m.6935 type:complete len:410 (-) Transcript_4685:2057-3286(-)